MNPAMHEVSIMDSTLRLAEKHARDAGASVITRLWLRIGPLSGVDPDALFFAFDALKEETLAQSASLQIERVPAQFHCTDCGADFDLIEARSICPRCKGLLSVAGGGGELELAKLEIN